MKWDTMNLNHNVKKVTINIVNSEASAFNLVYILFFFLLFFFHLDESWTPMTTSYQAIIMYSLLKFNH